ncbi:MAG: hypothetical protein ACKOOC_05565 [Cyanobium sp.]
MSFQVHSAAVVAPQGPPADLEPGPTLRAPDGGELGHQVGGGALGSDHGGGMDLKAHNGKSEKGMGSPRWPRHREFL